MLSSIGRFARKLISNSLFLGAVSLLWLLYRSGTKPSRIAYPCQRAAASASYAFLISPAILFLSGLANRFSLKLIRSAKYIKARTKEKQALIVLVILTLSSALLSGLAIYANLSEDLTEFLRRRTSLQEKLAIVSVVRVEGGDVEAALRRALDHLGGIESIVPEGSRVLIKPNLVRKQTPPDTTDPAIVEALVRIINGRNPKVVRIAEGSGEGNTFENFQALGYLQVAERTGAALVDLNYGEMENFTVPGGGIVFSSFTFNKVLSDVDVFISVAAMKTHSQAVVTLGMKNLIGIAPGSVYGFPKGVLHEGASQKGDDYMAGVIVDLCKARRIDLVVVDGRVGMEGQGPHEGTPVALDLLIVGRDPVATDSVAAFIMGFDPERVPTLELGSKTGLGTNNLHSIEIKGESIETVFRPFKSAIGHERFQMSLPSTILSSSKVLLAALAVILWLATAAFVLIRSKTFRRVPCVPGKTRLLRKLKTFLTDQSSP
jgi:uncharacterized protein (DUF362 family)